MNQETNKNLQVLLSQIQQYSKIKKFDLKTIQTLGVFRSSQLESFKHMKIRQQSFKQLLTKSLKLCYLYEPILKTLHEMQNTEELEYQNPNNLLKVNSILKILCESLFYRNMFKLKVDSYDSVINLVNNRSTEINRKVIIAGLVVYAAKKLTLEEIGAAMLIFNLEEALLKLRPHGLPLEQMMLQKCVKKLQRLISINDLRNFILTVKQQSKNQPILPRQFQNLQQLQALPYQNFLGPDQFLYLVALSQKKATSTLIFFQTYTKTQNKNQIATSQGIDAFMRQKKMDFLNGAENSVNGQSKQDKNIEVFENDPNNSFDKIQGLSLHSTQQAHIKNAENADKVYKEIKQYLYQSKPDFFKNRKTKSVKLQAQLNRNTRPSTAIFKRSIKILDKNCATYEKCLGKQINKQNATKIYESLQKKYCSFYKTETNKQQIRQTKFQHMRLKSQSISNSSYTNLSSYNQPYLSTKIKRSPLKLRPSNSSMLGNKMSLNPKGNKTKQERKSNLLQPHTKPLIKKQTITHFKEKSGHARKDKVSGVKLRINCNRDSIEDNRIDWFEVQKGKVFYDYEQP